MIYNIHTFDQLDAHVVKEKCALQNLNVERWLKREKEEEETNCSSRSKTIADFFTSWCMIHTKYVVIM